MTSGSTRGGRRFWAVVIALLAVNVSGLYWIRGEVLAADRAGVRVRSVSPTRRLEKADQLALSFDRPLAPAGRIGTPLLESPYRLEPSWAGHWEWKSPEQLVFVLAEPLAPGRRFTLTPSPDFTLLTGFELLGEERFELATARLVLAGVRVESADPKGATLALQFNQPVSPVELARHLTVRGRIQERG